MSRYIVGDWGSSNIRLFLCEDGKIIDTVRSDKGITVCKGDDCSDLFFSLCGKWISDKDIKVTLAGMVGSINGWVDAPYLNCPTNLNKLHESLCNVPNKDNLDIKIVPGLCVANQDNYNVMRGEETQLLGIINEGYDLCVMPGTHCKWVKLSNNEVLDFKTAMIGELHKLLMKQSLIGASIEEQEDNEASFIDGLKCGYSENNIILKLFECRAMRILNGYEGKYISEFLSGLLIGSEIKAIEDKYDLNKDSKVCIISSEFLAKRYIKAFELIGLKANFKDGDLAFIDGINFICKNR